MRRLSILAATCLLSGCATFGGGNETGRKYVVFFTTGSAHIDAPGRRVVAEAAAAALRHPDRNVMVAGYAAAHGNLSADERISAGRADTVAAALRADGVPESRITEHARPPANEDPAVAARRVEIGFVSQP
jgi:outer membrane protein OmpA-like peptidoglycan-associated protein